MKSMVAVSDNVSDELTKPVIQVRSFGVSVPCKPRAGSHFVNKSDLIGKTH